MTNVLFALIQQVTSARSEVWAWADHLVFWGMNAGLTGFLVTLIAQAKGMEKLFTPVMGGSILVGIVTYLVRFQRHAAARMPAPVPARS